MAAVEEGDRGDDSVVDQAAGAEEAGEPGGAAGGVDEEGAVDRRAVVELQAPVAVVAGHRGDAGVGAAGGAGGDGAGDEGALEAAAVEVPAIAIRREEEGHVVDGVASPAGAVAGGGEMIVGGDAE